MIRKTCSCHILQEEATLRLEKERIWKEKRGQILAGTSQTAIVACQIRTGECPVEVGTRNRSKAGMKRPPHVENKSKWAELENRLLITQ